MRIVYGLSNGNLSLFTTKFIENIKRHGHDSKKTMKSGRKIWKKVFNSDFDIPEKM